MPGQRRVWDSVIILGYLAGYEALRPTCPQIIQQAQLGEVEIIVSELAKVETAYLAGRSDSASEDIIREFFSREYIIPVSVDDPLSTIARGLVRKHVGLAPPDAIHLATAILWHVPVIETTDPDLLRLDQQEGNPPIIIRTPLYEGPQMFPGMAGPPTH
ncbi:MAG: hypothetical protein BZY87_05810 [SAR202 cluster bacterium Io17-Chloro-G6]|nr:MAG: hypothetical protein BZY87_05810 [SAR202 cluster bacterium Io17-Chloro-G6]